MIHVKSGKRFATSVAYAQGESGRVASEARSGAVVHRARIERIQWMRDDVYNSP